MIAITMAAQKGGTGKSTLAVHLAVHAQQQGFKSAIIDTDPQGSAIVWSGLREAETPPIIRARPNELKKVMSSLDVDLVIIDTAPSHGPDITAAAKVSDIALIPTRCAIFDLQAITPTLDLVAAVNTPSLIVLNAVPPSRGVGEASITKEAREFLEDAPVPVADSTIGLRVDYSHALIGGKAVSEFAPESKAAMEIASLWKELEICPDQV